MLNIQNKMVINVGDWDNLVEKTYGKVYSFQQQEGCQERGNFSIIVPCDDPFDYENDVLPEIANHAWMGVSFKAWLARPSEQELLNQKYDFELELWWKRNFYPNIDMLINDLYEKGLLPAGEYDINIDW